MFLLVVLVILFYFYKTGDLQRFLKNTGFEGSSNNSSNEAKKIIDMRLAKGEISVEEYNNLKKVL